MKKSLIIVVLTVITFIASAQEKLFVNLPTDSIIHVPVFTDFVPGEILVRYKDEVTITQRVKAGIINTGVTSIDKIFTKFNVTTSDRLFPNEEKLVTRKMLTTWNGQVFERPSLHNIFRIKLTEEINIFEAIEELKSDPAVIYAEPNYILSITDDQPVSPALDEKEMNEYIRNTQLLPVITAPVSSSDPDDPLYPQQWYIPAVHANEVWDTITGDSTQVIAILDTGVDWLHPDLQNKIWINSDDVPGNGFDDDGNGKVDDIRGWDWINNDNNPTDDNSHGTHVAGIAAAEANNGIGISGVSHGAKIMPLKVFQSSGRGNAATITAGIIYAKEQGATIMNMSFGSYAHSMTMEAALANAYASAVLVAASGNDGRCIGPGNPCAPMFPAALSFVLGTQSQASFSNKDYDGPVYSGFPDLWNYEMWAPGEEMLSTIPGGSYRKYQGTSMATPVISGAVAMYKSLFPDDSQELLWVKFIQSTSTYIDIYRAIHCVPIPQLWFVNNTIIDTLTYNDYDGKVDAGEKIQLWFNIRNTGGQSDSIFIKLELGEFEDPDIAQIINDSAFIGSASPYALHSNQLSPFLIHISPNATNDRDIVLEATMWYANSSDTVSHEIILNVENGEDLAGVMDTTMHLTADKLWLVNSSFRVGTNGVLIIEPGTKIIINQHIVNRGKILGLGTPDSLISITGPGTISYMYYEGDMQMTYTNFYGTTTSFTGDTLSFKNCRFNNLDIYHYIDAGFGSIFMFNNLFIENCIIENSIFGNLFYPHKPNVFLRNNIVNCLQRWPSLTTGMWTDATGGSYNNYYKIRNYYYHMYGGESNPSALVNVSYPSTELNNFISAGKHQYLMKSNGSGDVVNLSNNYWGSTDPEIIRSKIYDFYRDASLPMVNFYPIRQMPYDSAHAIVWKIEVNGNDAQDDLTEPLGFGLQRFDVFFNKPMDTTYIPEVSFGVRMPYTQTMVNDSSYWSDDSRVYTCFKSIQLYTGDGINRLRVAQARDLDGWEIPLEDMRFNVLIQAAGSLSTEFIASPGLGKINLEWNNSGIEDLLGFNMYRFQNITDSTFTNPVLINTTLITDTLYTDFNVLPNIRYYYYYKVLRTDFAESDSSTVISAIPLTASIGDANGDLMVNVLDITTIVAYLLNNNPQPFIYEAANMNGDETINVLDIVGVVNLVTGGAKSGQYTLDRIAHLYIENDTLFADAPAPVAGIQFDINGVTIEDIEILAALKGFETGYGTISNSLRMVFYSMSEKYIPAGYRIPLMKISKPAWLENTILADNSGYPLMIEDRPYKGNALTIKAVEVKQNYPNPFTGETTIPVLIYKQVDYIVLRIVNMYGQVVKTIELTNPEMGEHLLKYNTPASGILAYSVEIRRGNERYILPVKKMVNTF
ncbi:MAG: S8 family serine peptidase [Lentimicrobiaceae bacterium]